MTNSRFQINIENLPKLQHSRRNLQIFTHQGQKALYFSQLTAFLGHLKIALTWTSVPEAQKEEQTMRRRFLVEVKILSHASELHLFKCC
ncbi:hypothetical protein Nepgr_000323 [Nepenthes gracilis]|uniref:Uncharacterized protein n=1 Tax=Nepenthes gracilis TaxID=150966 RepID=A0AAD3P2U5_NEPGR|nr:hypothetical protein Nepgr_000323 [Nepenthes gracilis]